MAARRRNHPDEFLLKGEDSEYLENPNGSLMWHPDTKKAIEGITARGWVVVENQPPIINNVNDDANAHLSITHYKGKTEAGLFDYARVDKKRVEIDEGVLEAAVG